VKTGSTIEVRNLTKRYGKNVAVDDLSFGVRPGHVTGFLGPNGAGKSTTLRMVLGLDRPTAGIALVNGRPYRELAAPTREVGALLDPAALHNGRSGRAHLDWLARAGGIPRGRVAEVLDQVGLSEPADRAVGEFSLGMRQRLGMAAALLGDPGILLFDEPLNGLDPEGIVWVRTLLQGLAKEGRTVFLSSHLMNEMQATADHVLVIAQGRLLADLSVHEMISSGVGTRVTLVSPRAPHLRQLLVRDGVTVSASAQDPAELTVNGLDATAIGDIAAANRVPLHQLTTWQPRLEDAFITLTHGKGRQQAKEMQRS
jgi:ABC-2 type transport system ATP-binding protein